MIDIKKLRKAKGLTQSQLGERIGVVPQSICSYEKGLVLPSVQVMMAIGRELSFDWWKYYEDRELI